MNYNGNILSANFANSLKTPVQLNQLLLAMPQPIRYALFNPSDEERYAVYGTDGRAVLAPQQVTEVLANRQHNFKVLCSDNSVLCTFNATTFLSPVYLSLHSSARSAHFLL